jgi:ubiquinone/menaquinone biosynthesis C-methylase UbiE
LNPELLLETEKLTRSWAHHEEGWLRDYLVAGVEDPRLNVQSILSRHFLVRAIAPDFRRDEFHESLNSQRIFPGERFESLMNHEYRFAAVMDWLHRVARLGPDFEGRSAVLHALHRGADNAEGLEIPQFVIQTFARLPTEACGYVVPNYIKTFLSQEDSTATDSQKEDTILDTFSTGWSLVIKRQFPKLQQEGAFKKSNQPSVIEPACGSANDYRFLLRSGIAPLFDYTGFDLCDKNIENARSLFPGIRFEQGNVFEIPTPAVAFDLCVVHDLFEHLSIVGMEQAVSEVCRVTRRGIGVGFFQMDEIPEHKVRPVDEYHWNLLSLARMKDLFAHYGFFGQAIHIDTFLREQVGSPCTHNPNAYSFFLTRG